MNFITIPSGALRRPRRLFQPERIDTAALYQISSAMSMEVLIEAVHSCLKKAEEISCSFIHDSVS